MGDVGRTVPSMIYTVDPSIFVVPPNSNVLHAANETDFTQPDVFGVPSCQMAQAMFMNSTPLPPNESDLTAVRSDSATSHLRTTKPEDVETKVEDCSIDQQNNPWSIKRFMLRIFKCVKRPDAESVKGKQ